MRLFLAIDLPDDAKRSLSSVAAAACDPARRVSWGSSGVRWVRPDHLHLTLKFLGDVPDAALPGLTAALAAVPPVGPIALRTDGPLFFPPRGPVRVVAAKIAEVDDAKLHRLHRAIERACEAVGFEPEHRAFVPHVTLARSRDGLPDQMRHPYFLHDYEGLKPFPAAGGTVTEFVLYESRLLPGGPEYEVIERFPL